MKRLVFLTVYILLITYSINAQTNSTGNGNWVDVVQASYNIVGGTTVNIQHVVQANGEINVLFGGTLNILSDSLIINAGLVTFIGGNVTINEGAVLWINGDLDNTLGGDITVNGTLKVDGNVSNWGSDVTVGTNGNIGISGDFDNTGGTVDNSAGGNIVVGGAITPVGTVGGNVEEGVGPEAALPIELLYFKVGKYQNVVRLSWQTATEINNDYFTLERSIDGINFKIIGIVDGAGNSSIPLSYTYIDNNPINGVSYYRLIQTDYDGKYEVFNTVSLSYLNEDLFKISPNPASEKLTVNIGTNTGNGVLKIYDNMGRLIVNEEFNETYLSVDISRFPKGNYLVVFSNGYESITKKVIFH